MFRHYKQLSWVKENMAELAGADLAGSDTKNYSESC